MKTFPALFTVEKNKFRGACPSWIVQLTIEGVSYWIGDDSFEFLTYYDTYEPVYPAVLSWGSISEGLNNILSDAQISSFKLTLSSIANVSATKRVEELVISDSFVKNKVKLFEWFQGIAAIPQLVFTGYIDDIESWEDDEIQLSICDETYKYKKRYIGRKLSEDDYPDALEDDIGKVIPIPFGNVYKIPSVCVKDTSTYVYMFSDKSVSYVSHVYVRNSGIADILIDDYCTTYTGNTGDILSGYTGKGVLTITAWQATLIRRLVDIAINDPEHHHPTYITREQINSDRYEIYGGPSSTVVSCTPEYPATTGITEQTNKYEFSYGGNTYAKIVSVNGVTLHDEYSSGTISWQGTTAGNDPPTIVVRDAGDHANITVTMGACSRNIYYLSNTSDSSTDITLTKPDPSSAVSEAVLVTVMSPYGDPEGAMNWILEDIGLGSLSVVGSLPVSIIGGIINEYKTALEWLNILAFQCGGWFKISNEVPYLISKTRPVESIKSIPEPVMYGNKSSLSRTKMDSNDVINKITCLLNRDWTKSKGAEAYKTTVDLVDSSSREIYGTLEHPELFQFDFILTTPGSLLTWLLDYHKVRHWIYCFDVFLDHSELEFGDFVTLEFANDIVGMVMKAEHHPGDYNKMDIIKLTVIV